MSKNAEAHTLVGIVFIGLDGRPYLLWNGWICYWHADKRWVTLQKDDGRSGCFKPLPPEQAAMYGVESPLTFDHAKESNPAADRTSEARSASSGLVGCEQSTGENI